MDDPPLSPVPKKPGPAAVGALMSKDKVESIFQLLKAAVPAEGGRELKQLSTTSGAAATFLGLPGPGKPQSKMPTLSPYCLTTYSAQTGVFIFFFAALAASRSTGVPGCLGSPFLERRLIL